MTRPVPLRLPLAIAGTLALAVLLGACSEQVPALSPAQAQPTSQAPPAVAGSPGTATPVSPAAGSTAAGTAGKVGGPTGKAGAPAGSGQAAPPVPVTTVRALIREFPVTLRANGTVSPLTSVDVKPQMSSVIAKVHFKEGQFVKAGELLFTLDARADEANLARAQAQLARDQASLADAQRQLARAKQLLSQNFVSQGAVDTSQAQVDAQTAVIATDRAAIEAARVPLSYARIKAPNSGRAGAVTVFQGTAVIANQTTLVTVTQLDPIAVSFNLPQRHLQDVLALQSGGGAQVTATLPETQERLNGRLQFVDSLVDPNSGTVKVKAVFENKAGRLWPGAFAEVVLQLRSIQDAVVIPQAAIIETQRGPIVYVVEEGRAALKPVKVLHSQGQDAVIEGVRPGSAIVLDGRQSVRPGGAVVERPRDGAGGGGPGKGAGKGAGKDASKDASKDTSKDTSKDGGKP